MILGIETATENCSIAIVENGKFIDEISHNEKNIHAEKLVPMIAEIFSKNNLKISKLNGIAISIGPGSFTGLRIGLSVAKGIAFANDIPIFPIPTLMSLAENYFIKNHYKEIVVSIIQSQKDEFFVSSFEHKNKTTLQLNDILIVNKSENVDELFSKNHNYILLGNGAKSFFENLSYKNNFQNIQLASSEFQISTANSIAFLGEKKYLNNELIDIETLEPNYIKNFLIKKSTLFERIKNNAVV